MALKLYKVNRNDGLERRTPRVHINFVEFRVIAVRFSNQPIDKLFEKWESKGTSADIQCAMDTSNASLTSTSNCLSSKSAEPISSITSLPSPTRRTPP